MKNELIFYRRHLNWFFGLASIVFVVGAAVELKVQGLISAVFFLFGLLICLFQFIKPMMVLGDKNIRTRGITDLYFRIRLWSDIYKVETCDYGDPKKSALLIYDSLYSYKKYKMSPDELRQAFDFMSTKLPPEKLVGIKSKL
jgi:hypothetical protein